MKNNITSSESYKFLLEITELCQFEQSLNFYLKEPIKIGTCKYGDVVVNYIDQNCYDKYLAVHFLYNKQDDKLNGCKYDFSVIWLEKGEWSFECCNDIEIELMSNFIDVIAKEIESYSDLFQWCEYIKELGIYLRAKNRFAMQDKKEVQLTWNERIEWIQKRIEHDKLLNGHSIPYDQTILDEMLELGEKKYNEVSDKRNKIASDILKELLDDELVVK